MKAEEMYFVEHLGELRKRIIITLAVFIGVLAVSFFYVQPIYDWLIRDLDQQLAVLGPSEILWVYFMISGVIAIALTIPVAAHQTWMFIKPALSKTEQKVTLSYIPALFLLFLLGLAFGYFIVYPMVLNFLLGLSEGHFQTFFTSEKYFKFMMNLTLPFGFLFEIPLVVMFLTSLGILNPFVLAKARKVSYFALVVVAVLITPPDLVSDFLVVIPLLVLYEVSIMLSRWIFKKKLAKEVQTNIENEEDKVIQMKRPS